MNTAMNKTLVKGYIRAISDQAHPLQTKLSLILTDFEPNANLQGIPQSERDNILSSAMYMPLKINFDGEAYDGHNDAYAVGPIISTYMGEDNGREVVLGDAIIWNELHQDVSQFLKEAFSEGIGTSWEIYYQDSQKDAAGIEWLSGCMFAGTCIVEEPAYGPKRTRVLALAEKLKQNEVTMAKVQATTGEDKEKEEIVIEENKEEAATITLDETRDTIIAAEDILYQMFSALDTLYSETFEVEAQQVTQSLDTVAQNFADMISKISKQMQSFKTDAQTAQSELNTIKQDRVEAERKTTLFEAGIDEELWNEKKTTYLDMTEETFASYISDMTRVSQKAAKAEKTITLVPESFRTSTMTVKELAEELKAAISTKRI